ncbi:MAG: hypothetical protein IJ072_07140, partial [Oscillospiraceae bacterium]|nr:hypothetical protein [Oscillospiraceae bacterium]
MRASGGISRFIFSAICASLISAGNVFCIATAFDIPCRGEIIAAVCVLCAILFSLILWAKRPLPWLLLTALVAAAVVYKLFPELKGGAMLCLRQIAQAYVDGFKKLEGTWISAGARNIG